ncbi:MAG: germination protein YpeB [Clostridia bacterium]|nr:germination protein YpeB [Clostridia bacterium]
MFEKFEKKIIEIKRKFGEKKLGITFFSIFCIIILFSMMLLKQYKIEKQSVQDGYNRSMYDFVADVNNIENEIAKLKITSNDTYTLTTLASIFAKANSAKANLDILPFSENSVSNVSKFLTQVSDFSYSLMRNVINGENISDYKEQIDTIYTKISDLSDVTEEIYAELNSKSIKWDELENIGNEKLNTSNAEEELSTVNKIGKTFTEYEGIIYDGAFSDHILTIKPAFLTGEELSQEEVKNILNQKLNVESINFIEEQNGRIALYVYEVKIQNTDVTKTIYATKQDGRIYQMVSDRNVERENIDIEQAERNAQDFLNNLGIENIEPTYYLKNQNMVTISFAAIQGDVLIYSDLIKVKVALDNGEIMCVEANGYIFNHKEREITANKTIEEAKATLYQDLNIDSERMCIIPTDAKDEVLVYEFKGTVEDKTFLVYINANTLVEEKIYILLDTQGGTIAI